MKFRKNVRIGVYVLSKHAKQTYSKECYNIRINAGMAVVVDILKRNGYESVEYVSKANAHRLDVILYSVTSDCDWWNFIEERIAWKKGDQKVIVGGAGVLNARPFLEFVDYFVLGRAENVIEKAVEAAAVGEPCDDPHVITSATFDKNKRYRINQTDCVYPHYITLENGKKYHEDTIGCNHRCLFCGYTWHRRQAQTGSFEYSGLWNGGKDRERAMIDMDNGIDVDLVKLRTTAIDGLSERLRFKVNKRITSDMLREFIERLAKCEKPHQVKFYNIIGYPTETEADWWEFVNDIKAVDDKLPKSEKQTSILLHSTPFRAMPATPMACEPMEYTNFRGKIAKVLGGDCKGNIFYQGNAMWAVESMATDSLATVAQSAIIWRGTEFDADNIVKVATSKKFKAANSKIKQITLEKYFDMNKLFGRFTAATLPTRYLKTYCEVEKMWEEEQ